MELLNYLGIGFSVALQPVNLFYCFVGVFIGTLVGVLPGIGPVGAMSLLLPTTFKAPPEAAIIMLAGIYYGAMYGGSTTSILVNIPGEAASVVTCLDGYQMARQGRAGPALGIAAFSSFIAGTIGIDPIEGAQRFTFERPELMEGIGLVPIAMGMFGISEILLNIEKKMKISIFEAKLKGFLPNLQDWRNSLGAILRGT